MEARCVQRSIRDIINPALKHHTMETLGVIEIPLHALLTSVPDECESPASPSGRFTLSTRWIKDWVVSTVRMDPMEKRKIPTRNGTPAV
jgi:hypothetical protein